MQLRIHRTWSWEPNPNAELRLGGPPNLILTATDTLEALIYDEWVPVPIVEGTIPEHPADARRREQSANLAALIAGRFAHLNNLKTKEKTPGN